MKTVLISWPYGQLLYKTQILFIFSIFFRFRAFRFRAFRFRVLYPAKCSNILYANISPTFCSNNRDGEMFEQKKISEIFEPTKKEI